MDIRIGAVNNFNRNADPAVVDIALMSPSDMRERRKSRRRRARAQTWTTATTFDGRAGLDVTWNTAAVHRRWECLGLNCCMTAGDDSSRDERDLDQSIFDAAVSYILVVDGDELTTGRY